jgi:hypothetical protein
VTVPSRLPNWYLAAAAACLLAGLALGLAMGVLGTGHLVPAHAQLHIVGWASLALMGLTCRGFPELAARRGPALTQFWLSAGSAMVFPAGLWLAVAHGRPGLAVAAGVLWFAGAALFLVQLVRLGLRETGGPAPGTAIAVE